MDRRLDKPLQPLVVIVVVVNEGAAPGPGLVEGLEGPLWGCPGLVDWLNKGRRLEPPHFFHELSIKDVLWTRRDTSRGGWTQLKRCPEKPGRFNPQVARPPQKCNELAM